MKKLIILLSLITIAGCAGINPNLGERTADTLWHRGDVASSRDILKKNADNY